VALGAALGSVDIAMNTQAVTVQRRLGRSVMSMFHAVYSVGGFLGASIGGLFAAHHVSPRTHFALVGTVAAAAGLAASLWLLPSPAEENGPGTGEARRRSPLPARYRVPLLLLGVVGFCSMAAEGAVGDWAGVYLHDNLGAGE